MRRTQKVYLDTSVVSALFDERTPERKNTTEQFWDLLSTYEAYFSQVGVKEISAVRPEWRERFNEKVEELIILEITPEMRELARAYVDADIIPVRYIDDALHIAVAVVSGMDFVVSWNFKHMVKVKTRRMVNLINATMDYPPVEIISPPEL